MIPFRQKAAILLVLSLLLVSPDIGLALSESEVSESLLCFACPGEPLSIDRCGGGDQMPAAISRMLGEGKSKEEILQYFVGEFGEEILTIPPKRGFNLVAYIGPFAVLLLGVAVAFLLIRKWSSAGTHADRGADGTASPPPLGDADRRRVEEALSNFHEED